MEQFNDDRFFQYPPFNRHHTWRRDYEYEVPVVSSVGNGPKGDPMHFEDLTEEQISQITGPAGTSVQNADISSSGQMTLVLSDGSLILVDGNARGPKGDKGDKGDTQTLEDLTETQLEYIITQTIASGAKGDKGDTGDFSMLTEAQQQIIADYVGSQVANLALDDIWYAISTPVDTDSDNPFTGFTTNIDSAGLHNVQLYISGLCVCPTNFTVTSVDDKLAIELAQPIVHPNTLIWIYANKAHWEPQQ